MSEKGVSLVALIVTIIIIILLATIGGFYSVEILDKAERMKTEEELRNVDELVSVQRGKIRLKQIQLPDTYVATDAEIDAFDGIDTEKLSSTDIQKIKTINNNANLSEEYKYHLMDQAAFDSVFGGDVNVRDVRYKYLINFDEKIIILNAGGRLYIVGEIE